MAHQRYWQPQLLMINDASGANRIKLKLIQHCSYVCNIRHTPGTFWGDRGDSPAKQKQRIADAYELRAFLLSSCLFFLFRFLSLTRFASLIFCNFCSAVSLGSVVCKDCVRTAFSKMNENLMQSKKQCTIFVTKKKTMATQRHANHRDILQQIVFHFKDFATKPSLFVPCPAL